MSSFSVLSTSPPTEGTNSSVLVPFTWTVSCDAIKNTLYDDDIYYEYDDYADDVKIESPPFGPVREPDKFLLRLYPRSTEGCSDVGSLILALRVDDDLRVEKLKVSITGYSKSEEKVIDGICRKSTALLAQSLGWRNTFDWKDLIRHSANLIIYVEVAYQMPGTVSHGMPPTTRSYHQQRLSEDFGTLLSRSRHCDVLLHCGGPDGAEFPAHKAILSARSAVFDVMFSHDECSESQQRRVNIDDIEPQVMESLLAYIYTGDTAAVDQYNVELLAAADKYDIPSLIKVCIQSMLHSITIDTAARLLYTADLHELDELKQEAIVFINRHPQLVMASEGWTAYLASRADLLGELYGNLAERTGGVGMSRFH